MAMCFIYVSGPPPTFFFEKREITEIHGLNAHMISLKDLDFRRAATSLAF